MFQTVLYSPQPGSQGQTHLSSGCCRGFGINVLPWESQCRLSSRLGLNLRPMQPTLNANLSQKDPRHCTIREKSTSNFHTACRGSGGGVSPAALSFKLPNFQRTGMQHSSFPGLSEYLRVRGEVGGGMRQGFGVYAAMSQGHELPKAPIFLRRWLLSPLTWAGHRKVVPPCGHFLLLQRTIWCFKALHHQRTNCTALNKEHLP